MQLFQTKHLKVLYNKLHSDLTTRKMIEVTKDLK